MEMIRVTAAGVNKIFFNKHIRRALIEINSPAAVAALLGVCTYIVNYITRNDRVRLVAEHINSAHVGEPALTDIVYKVVANSVVIANVVGVAPNPAD